MSKENEPERSSTVEFSNGPAGLSQASGIAPLSAYLVRALRHELVQPLHSISLMIDLAPIHGQSGDVAEWTTRIDRALDGMKRMLNGLSEASRFELEPPEPALVQQSVQPILASLAEQFREPSSRAGMVIGLSAQQIKIATDEALLKQGLQRLLDNAIRHSQASAVTLDLERVGNSVRLIVRDDGIGLSALDIERSLAPLGTGSNARIKGTAGLGMGLTIAQQVARALGYGFDFRSEPGGGTSAGYIVPDA
jgi:signal transduction histidine kinase